MDLPTRIGNVQAQVLSLLVSLPANEEIKSSRLKPELDAIEPDIYGTRMDNMVAKFKNLGFLKNSKNFGFYVVTPLGRKFDSLIKAGKITIQHMPSRAGRKPKAAAIQAPAEPVQVNLSARANTLADSLAEVLQENAQLRDLLLKLHSTIGNALELNKPEE